MLRIISGDGHDLFELATTLLKPEIAAATPVQRRMHVVVKPNWVQHRAESESREVRYGTTPRFLKVFGLASLDELPRLGDTSQV